MKIQVNSETGPQHIEMHTGLDPDGKIMWSWVIILNSFNTAHHEYGFDSNEDAFHAGAVALHEYIMNHMHSTTQRMSDGDKDMIVDFFTQVQILNKI